MKPYFTTIACKVQQYFNYPSHTEETTKKVKAGKSSLFSNLMFAYKFTYYGYIYMLLESKPAQLVTMQLNRI